jgi:hypothetical protein
MRDASSKKWSVIPSLPPASKIDLGSDLGVPPMAFCKAPKIIHPGTMSRTSTTPIHPITTACVEAVVFDSDIFGF